MGELEKSWRRVGGKPACGQAPVPYPVRLTPCGLPRFPRQSPRTQRDIVLIFREPVTGRRMKVRVRPHWIAVWS